MVFLAGDTVEEKQKQRRERQIPRLGGTSSGKHTVLTHEDRLIDPSNGLRLHSFGWSLEQWFSILAAHHNYLESF